MKHQITHWRKYQNGIKTYIKGGRILRKIAKEVARI